MAFGEILSEGEIFLEHPEVRRMTFWKERRVLVTGCTGFMGWWLTAALVERGAHVVGLVRDQVPSSPFYLNGLSDQVKVVRGTVEDYATVERAINEYDVDTVFHLAGQAIVGVAERNPLSTFETNIKGTWVVLEACRRNSQVSRMVVASSDRAYGRHDTLPYSEQTALVGDHPYDVSKSCADLIAMTYRATYGTPVAVTRCGNLFGPGDLNFNRIVPGAIRAMLLGERPVIRSDGSPVRDYMYMEEIVAAFLLLAERMDDPRLHGRAFNFGTGEPVSVIDLTRRILRLGGREDLEPIILNRSSGEIPQQFVSAELARTLLGWEPRKRLDESLKATIAWYDSHRGVL
jgi:CDP-glucose 4,6-dehydratase